MNKKKLRNAGGIALIVIGVLGLLLPLLPGIPFLIAGVAILGKEHTLVRTALNWLEKKGIRLGGGHTALV